MSVSGPAFTPGNLFKSLFLKNLPKTGSMISRVREAFERTLEGLVADGFVVVDEDGNVFFTPKGVKAEKLLSLTSKQRGLYANNILMASMESAFRDAAMGRPNSGMRVRENVPGYPLSADPRRKPMKTVDVSDPSKTLLEEGVIMYRPKIKLKDGKDSPEYRPRLYLKIDPNTTTVAEARAMREKVKQRAVRGVVYDDVIRRSSHIKDGRRDEDAPYDYPVYLPPNVKLVGDEPSKIREVVPRGRAERHLGPRGQASFEVESPISFRLGDSRVASAVVLDVVYTASVDHGYTGPHDISRLVAEELFPMTTRRGIGRNESEYLTQVKAFHAAAKAVRTIYSTPFEYRDRQAFRDTMEQYGITGRALLVFSEMRNEALMRFYKTLYTVYQTFFKDIDGGVKSRFPKEFQRATLPKLSEDPKLAVLPPSSPEALEMQTESPGVTRRRRPAEPKKKKDSPPSEEPLLPGEIPGMPTPPRK